MMCSSNQKHRPAFSRDVASKEALGECNRPAGVVNVHPTSTRCGCVVLKNTLLDETLLSVMIRKYNSATADGSVQGEATTEQRNQRGDLLHGDCRS